MEVIGLAGDDKAGTRLTVLRAIDKLDKIGPSGVRDLLGAGRWENPEEKSGDFTKGAGLQPEAADVVLAFVASGADSAADTVRQPRQAGDRQRARQRGCRGIEADCHPGRRGRLCRAGEDRPVGGAWS